MINLLWALLNIGLFLFFIVICFKATKLVREKIGLFASVVFVLGLLSFVSNSNNDNNKEPNSNRTKTWEFAKETNLNQNEEHLISVDLEKNLVSKYLLDIEYRQDKLGQTNIPISASSNMTGLISGISWNPSLIVVNKTTDNNKFEYFVIGVVKWKLLGATIYSQPKEYKGIALTK